MKSMAKDNNYINNIAIICGADIRAGNRLELEKRLKHCIEKEDYETAQGISRALNK